ncbi:MAG: hypothetical protein Q6370_005765, partial [Candidatus Sigynarchaeota archaeon]
DIAGQQLVEKARMPGRDIPCRDPATHLVNADAMLVPVEPDIAEQLGKAFLGGLVELQHRTASMGLKLSENKRR